jgi:hypothetical protein
MTETLKRTEYVTGYLELGCWVGFRYCLPAGRQGIWLLELNRRCHH